jgi:cation:H+ antiporter
VVWLIFLVAVTAIVLAGTVLARNADIIAERSGLGHVWIGTFLLATATSLPELTVDTSAILRGVPELATGDLFGSNMANMAILGMLGLVFARRQVIRQAGLGVAVPAIMAILMTGIAILFIITRPGLTLGSLSLGSVALVACGITAAVIMRANPEEHATEPASPSSTAVVVKERSLRIAFVWFAGAALVILVAGPFLVISAEEIVARTGVSETFLGVLALAIATSLPELATTIAAIRIGAIGLAVGNLFGSNMFNMAILAWLDVVHTEGPLLETIDEGNAVAGLVAILMMSLGLLGVLMRRSTRLPFDPIAALIVASYGLGLWLVWNVSAA